MQSVCSTFMYTYIYIICMCYMYHNQVIVWCLVWNKSIVSNCLVFDVSCCQYLFQFIYKPLFPPPQNGVCSTQMKLSNRFFFPLLSSRPLSPHPLTTSCFLTFKSKAMILMLSFANAARTGKTKVSLCWWLWCVWFECFIALSVSTSVSFSPVEFVEA